MSIQDKLDKLKNFSPAKRELILKKLREKRARQKSTEMEIPGYERTKPVPLSLLQEQVWFLEQLVPNSNAYNMPMAMYLTGAINYHAMKQAVNEMGRRHEILRTTFKIEEERPFQCIHEKSRVIPKIIDLKGLDKQVRNTLGKELASEGAKKPFDLGHYPIMRIHLIEIQKDKLILLFVIHHMLSDNRSLRLFIEELMVLYNAFSKGEPSPIKERTLQYADYCYWEQEMLQEEETQKEMLHLKQKLQGKIAELNLPLDHERAFGKESKAKCLRFVLPPQVVDKMKMLSKQENITSFIILFTIYNTLFYRYTKQEYITVGTPVSNRPKSVTEELIGPFLNVFVICTRFEEKMTFRDVLRQMRMNVLDAHAHKQVPIWKILKELQPERNVNALSLFQVLFNFLNVDMDQWFVDAPKGVKMELSVYYDLLVSYNTPKFDLELTMGETPDGTGGNLEYDSAIFDETTVSKMIDHFIILLEAMLDDPNQCISSVMLEDEAKKEMSRRLQQEIDFEF